MGMHTNQAQHLYNYYYYYLQVMNAYAGLLAMNANSSNPQVQLNKSNVLNWTEEDS